MKGDIKMTKKRKLHGKWVYETIYDSSDFLKLDESALTYIYNNNADVIIISDLYKNVLGILITDTYELGEKMYTEYFGPRMVIETLNND